MKLEVSNLSAELSIRISNMKPLFRGASYNLQRDKVARISCWIMSGAKRTEIARLAWESCNKCVCASGCWQSRFRDSPTDFIVSPVANRLQMDSIRVLVVAQLHVWPVILSR